ncbi:MAG: DUF2073 domain-containing protein [Candidatus Methanolliviera hydrocarbonicum]|jgi:Uncharacterized protein conserved in archaea|uniref:DUF2073 domain-containing protein n=1 Tax=Candidatus Methanolliviera hydrocarbonicum TaxID=2491085 RepID=A0A520KY74_9EURY|nr:MAG: DUF2073 domain-containing protein [Candidatus Methanolliviera hydrocarbonicum]
MAYTNISGEKMVRVDMISEDLLASMTSAEKIRMILDGVIEGKILVLERGLMPEEEAKLIEATMVEISPEFVGIEIESYPAKERRSLMDRLFGRTKSQARLTVIGSPNQLKTIKKDRGLITALISEV